MIVKTEQTLGSTGPHSHHKMIHLCQKKSHGFFLLTRSSSKVTSLMFTPPIVGNLGANSYLCCKLRSLYSAKLCAILHIFVL